MAKEATIEVVNLKDRTYNGIKKGQRVRINQSQLGEYLGAGFETLSTHEVESVEPPKEPPAPVPKFDRQGAIEKLKNAGVQFKEVGISNKELESLVAELPPEEVKNEEGDEKNEEEGA